MICFLLLVACGVEVSTTKEPVREDEKLNEEKPIQKIETIVEDLPEPTEEDQQKEGALEELEKRRINVLNSSDYGESTQFHEFVAGVKTRMKTEEKVIALTLDACGGETGSGYDDELIGFLVENQIKANLFVNARWIKAQPTTFLELANNPLFTIDNHGTEHRPLSTVPRSAWGIESTGSVEEIVDEIIGNQKLILEQTGKLPKHFRSGTAYYDEVSVKIAQDLGLEVVNFDILGDAGATFTADQVKDSMLQADSGSIVILHMNHPESDTADGVKMAVLSLLEQGFSFVHLNDYELE
ncbi:peptidoglycan/xylan/chitin deacetylase (PgdA/CDA1 family) [Bacillus tianshenii]|uniref:Peptidoglycan/xylan/chitin deacetylase (PgdA/CDA1 family) n=1 Tax=Sutcliffiella tianshenii TaxID=1463404 RepID=A0ABS2P5M3_9BACI|nr:polysaccharide deacetylase family protein [Bacillus tianshenii]MBM7622261.1 peptidoglycan/xylan/chitin deacetylase (PgdA/CDA1 family) [Bacillus tianshenii]